MRNLSIESLVHIDAPNIVTSLDLENMMSDTMNRLNIPFGSFEALTGIKERRWWDEGVLISDVATEVGRKAIEKANIKPEQIGYIINCSVTKDFTMEPTLSVISHNSLGLSDKCKNFDISCTCAGFAAALDVASGLLNDYQADYILIIASESIRMLQTETTKRLNTPETTLTDIFSQIVALTFGSGAVAMIVTRKELSTTNHIINNSIFMADTQHNMLTYATMDYIFIEGRKLLESALYIDSVIWERAQEELNWKNDCIDLYIPHQVSSKNNDSFFNIPNIKTDRNKHKFIFEKFGNQGPAGWVITLSKAVEENDWTDKRIGVLSIGSGFNAYLIDIKW